MTIPKLYQWPWLLLLGKTKDAHVNQAAGALRSANEKIKCPVSRPYWNKEGILTQPNIRKVFFWWQWPIFTLLNIVTFVGQKSWRIVHYVSLFLKLKPWQEFCYFLLLFMESIWTKQVMMLSWDNEIMSAALFVRACFYDRYNFRDNLGRIL